MQVWLNGKILAESVARISPQDHGFLYGDGVYETLRTVEGKVFDAAAHFIRMQNSAKLLKIPLPYSQTEIFAATEQVLTVNNFSAPKIARLRWTLTRGENHFDFSDSTAPTFLITAVPLEPYPEEYLQHGVSVTTLETVRALPQAKTIALLPMILGKQRCEETKSFECLFLENGYITEGTVSNFCIQIEKALWIPPQGKVLHGTAAEHFFKKVKQLGYTLQEKLFSSAEVVERAEAAFLTNSLFGILPVTKIEQQKIAHGKVPEFFHELHHNFWNN